MIKLEILPPSLSGDELSEFIRKNAKSQHVHSEQIFFSEDEISDFEKLSCNCGREILRLEFLKKEIIESIIKGCDEEIEISVPVSIGTKKLKKKRETLDGFVDKGYEEKSYNVYSFPSFDGFMNFCDEFGNEIIDRKRTLSHRERELYGINLFSPDKIKTT